LAVIEFWEKYPATDDVSVEEMLRITEEYERIKDNEDWEWDLLLFIMKMGLSINQVRRALDLEEVVI
jgi:hypothetical protein